MQIHSIADFCEAFGLPVTMVPEVVEAFQRRELVDLAAQGAKLRRCARRLTNEALPLRDESGYEFGRVEARIPRHMFFNLMQRPGFGYDGLTSEDGLKDILRDFPQCRVKTVSGRIVSGYSGPPRKTVKRYTI